MLTPQEITDKVFVKAVFGGYDMTGVDDFLEELYTDYTSLYKENAILKGKLKVLVEKVEEYRSTEDAMRMALLTAQRLGEEITFEANKQKEETLQNAELEAKAKLEETAERIANEELRLTAAAKETARFIELSQAIMRKHSEFLAKLETARRAARPEPAASAAFSPEYPDSAQSSPTLTPMPLEPDERTRDEQITDAAEIIGNVMEKLTGGRESPPDISDETEPLQIPEDDVDSTKLYIPKDLDDSLTPRPKFDFDDLKFGSNFSVEE